MQLYFFVIPCKFKHMLNLNLMICIHGHPMKQQWPVITNSQVICLKSGKSWEVSSEQEYGCRFIGQKAMPDASLGPRSNMLEEGQCNRAAKSSLIARLINLCGLPSKCNITAFGASSVRYYFWRPLHVN